MKRFALCIAMVLCASGLIAQTSYRGSGGTGTATDTTSLSNRIDAKQDEATLADSLRKHGAGLGVLSKGEPVFAGSADSMYSGYQVVPIFCFEFGSGAAGDTTALTSTANLGSFYNKTDTLVITSLMCVMKHGIGTDTCAVQVSWDDSLNGAVVTTLNSAAFPVNSITTGNEDTSFDNSVVPPGRYVWGTVPGIVAGRKPTALFFTISGYFRKPR